MGNDFSYKTWIKNLDDFISARQKAQVPGFTAEKKIAPVQTTSKIDKLRKALAVEIPASVIEFLSSASGGCRFRYEWDFAQSQKEIGSIGINDERIYGGVELCVAASIAEWMADCAAWANESWIADDAEQQEIWQNSFPVATIQNGDYLGIKMGQEGDSPVVYLSHDDESRTIAPSFEAFLKTWEELCYIGPEIWMLQNFIDPETGFLDSATEDARNLRAIFSLKR